MSRSALARLLESSSFSSGASSKREASLNDGCSSVLGRYLDVGARELDEAGEEPEPSLHVLGGRRVVTVLDRLDRPGVEAAAVGQLDQAEAAAALDDDVQPPVVEPLGDLDDARQRPRPAKPVVVGVDEPEGLVRLEALGDQLPVARLEDVERYLLGREQDEAERKEPDLHSVSVERRSTARGAGA